MIYIRLLTHRLRVSPKSVLTCFVFVLVLPCPVAVLAQGTPPSWVQAFGSSGSGNNISNAIKVGPDQNLYVTGQFSTTANFGGTSITSAGGLDIFVAKYSPSGSLQWVAQAGGPDDDTGQGIDLDADGNVYVSGYFGGPGGSATFYSANQKDTKIIARYAPYGGIFLAKYSSSGTLLWIQTGLPGIPAAHVTVNVAAGTVYIAGQGNETVTLSSADGTSWFSYAPNYSPFMFLAKYDTNGNLKWAAQSYGYDVMTPNGVAVDSGDNAYAIGWFNDGFYGAYFYSADGDNTLLWGFGQGVDTFLVKYDKNGNVQWVNEIGGSGAEPGAVAVGPGGEVTVVGFLNNGADTTITSQPPGTNINLGSGTNPGGTDGFIATYTPAGVAIGATRHGGSSSNSTTGVAYDSRDNLYATGLVEGTSQPQLFVDEYSGKNLLWEATASAGIWIPPIFLTPRCPSMPQARHL